MDDVYVAKKFIGQGLMGDYVAILPLPRAANAGPKTPFRV